MIAIPCGFFKSNRWRRGRLVMEFRRWEFQGREATDIKNTFHPLTCKLEYPGSRLAHQRKRIRTPSCDNAGWTGNET